MFDIGWTEMLLLGIVGLLVIGPRELPGLLRTVGQYVGRMQQMARDFRRQMDDIADETSAAAELDDLVKDPLELGVDLDAPDLFDAPEKTPAEDKSA